MDDVWKFAVARSPGLFVQMYIAFRQLPLLKIHEYRNSFKVKPQQSTRRSFKKWCLHLLKKHPLFHPLQCSTRVVDKSWAWHRVYSWWSSRGFCHHCMHNRNPASYKWGHRAEHAEPAGEMETLLMRHPFLSFHQCSQHQQVPLVFDVPTGG